MNTLSYLQLSFPQLACSLSGKISEPKSSKSLSRIPSLNAEKLTESTFISKQKDVNAADKELDKKSKDAFTSSENIETKVQKLSESHELEFPKTKPTKNDPQKEIPLQSKNADDKIFVKTEEKKNLA